MSLNINKIVEDTFNSEKVFDTSSLNEITIFSSQSDGYSVHIDPDLTHRPVFINNPYIKVYDNISYTKATSSIRVHIFYPQYEYHKDKFKDLKWSAGLAKFLNNIMGQQSMSNKYANVTVFESILLCIEEKCNLTDDEKKILRSHKLIDFNQRMIEV